MIELRHTPSYPFNSAFFGLVPAVESGEKPRVQRPIQLSALVEFPKRLPFSQPTKLPDQRLTFLAMLGFLHLFLQPAASLLDCAGCLSLTPEVRRGSMLTRMNSRLSACRPFSRRRNLLPRANGLFGLPARARGCARGVSRRCGGSDLGVFWGDLKTPWN